LGYYIPTFKSGILLTEDMSAEFTAKSLCILGRQPKLGLAELESLYGDRHLKSLAGATLLDVEARDIDFRRLGGTVKVAKLLNVLSIADWSALEKYLLDNIPKHLKQLPDGKFTLGISVYGLGVESDQINQTLLKIKKVIRVSGRPVRVVPNQTPHLNAAQVLYNRLVHKGGWELLLVRDGSRTVLAQTLFVQDIEAYAARDQARPKRDARIGMLPPKLAQIIINLANPPAGSTILDPFCGTGVTLQEAWLMGYSVIGTDIEERMVEFSAHNLEWLQKQFSKPGAKTFFDHADATKAHWPPFDAVASETYLGRPLNNLPPPEKLDKIVRDVNTILEKFLKNLSPQLGKNTPVSLAVPSWRADNGSFRRLPLLDQLGRLGYNRVDFKHVARDKLMYFRPGQVVARELVVLNKL